MNKGYKYRGWFWMALCAVSIVALIVDLAIGRGAYQRISSVIICAAGVLYHRRLKQPDWEETYGIVDERETQIRATAASLTIKIMGIGMYGAAMLMGNGPASWALIAAAVIGAAVYFIAMLIVERKM
ncbi:MAG: hypothetical protein LUH42_06865 [Oscillospiraceae bacterium]|nr:hypothetical protein [Oscillospiraceae bacterium]